MNRKPHHIALKVRDLARCSQFYAGILDLEVMQRHTDQEGAIRSLWFDLGGVLLMLERWEGEAAVQGNAAGTDALTPGWHLLALTITPASRAGWREKLRRAGVLITGESKYSIYFADPEGNRLALSHYPESEQT